MKKVDLAGTKYFGNEEVHLNARRGASFIAKGIKEVLNKHYAKKK